MREITLKDFEGIDIDVEDDWETRNLDMLATVASHFHYLESLDDIVQDLTLALKKRKFVSFHNQGNKDDACYVPVVGDSVVNKRKRGWIPTQCCVKKEIKDVLFHDKKMNFDRCAAVQDDVEENKGFWDVQFQENNKTKFNPCGQVCDAVEETKLLVHGGAQTVIWKKGRTFDEKSQQEKGVGRLILKISPLNQPPVVTPVMPESYLKAITELSGGWILSWDDMELVIQKKLRKTDLTRHHNRFSIPSKQMKCGDFLYDKERTHLQTRNSHKRLNYMKVKIVEPNLTAGTVKLSMWESSNLYYVFNGTWSDIVERNKLEEGMVLQVWTYRVQNELWFALLKMPQIGR